MQVLIPIKIESVDLQVTSSKEFPGSKLIVSGKLARGISVRTKRGRDLSKAPWSFQIVPMEAIAAFAKEKEAIGICTFLDDFDDPDYGYDASFDGHIGMTPNEMQTIISAWLAGKQFPLLVVTVDGMEFDWEPDGSGKLWDEESKHRAVIDARLDISDAPLASVDQQSIADHFAPIALSERDIAPILKQLKDLSSTALFLLGAVVIGVCIILLK